MDKHILLFGIFILITQCRSKWLENCGISKYEDAGVEPTIVGGWTTRPHEFPWQISMHRLRSSGNFTHSCGGSIINQDWIVTAAHCVDTSELDTLQIHIGAHNLSEPDDNVLRILGVSEIVVYPEWNPDGTQNDIALLRLNETIQLNENVAGVCPANASINYEGLPSVVSGWGALAYVIDPDNRELPDTLQAVRVPVTPQDACVQRYDALGFVVTDAMICAGRVNETEHDACQGDSGGPLVWQTDNGQFELIGIVSTGFGCANRAPGIYARVSLFLDWIDSIISA